MAEQGGWVKIHRKFLQWGWYEDHVTKAVFLHLLITATYKDRVLKGKSLKRGQTITSRGRLSKDLGISEQSIRTALTRLISTNEITSQTSTHYTLITIVNYDTYQPNDQPTNQQLTNNQPATNHIQELKELKKEEIQDPPTPKGAVFFAHDFIQAYNAYPGTKSKTSDWQQFQKKHRDWREALPLLLPGIEKEIAWRKTPLPLGRSHPPWKHFKTWLNNRCWEQELELNPKLTESSWERSKRMADSARI